MATKTTKRNFALQDQGTQVPPRTYEETAANLRYFDGYAKKHYRTLGFKLNVEKEKDVLAYLDYQPNLKPYLVSLIRKDMEENPEVVDKALQLYNAEMNMRNQGITPKAGDILMTCECGHQSIITRKSYFTKPEKFVCQKCGKQMTAVNPPSKEVEEIFWRYENMKNENK